MFIINGLWECSVCIDGVLGMDILHRAVFIRRGHSYSVKDVYIDVYVYSFRRTKHQSHVRSRAISEIDL